MGAKDEIVIHLSNGEKFYTGGWETTGSLRATLHREMGKLDGSIAGSFKPNSQSYLHTYIDPASVVAIVDLREETV